MSIPMGQLVAPAVAVAVAVAWNGMARVWYGRTKWCNFGPERGIGVCPIIDVVRRLEDQDDGCVDLMVINRERRAQDAGVGR